VFKYCECSAKTGYQIANLFEDDVDDFGDEDEEEVYGNEFPGMDRQLSSGIRSYRNASQRGSLAFEPPKRVELLSLGILERATRNSKIQTVTNSFGPAGTRTLTPHGHRMRRRATSDSSFSVDSSILTESILEQASIHTAEIANRDDQREVELEYDATQQDDFESGANDQNLLEKKSTLERNPPPLPQPLPQPLHESQASLPRQFEAPSIPIPILPSATADYNRATIGAGSYGDKVQQLGRPETRKEKKEDVGCQCVIL
jgi:hypothetical protein